MLVRRHSQRRWAAFAIIVAASRADDAEQRFASWVREVAGERFAYVGSVVDPSAQQHSAPGEERSGIQNLMRGLEEIHRDAKTVHGKAAEKKDEVGDKFGRPVEEDFTDSDVVCGINLLGFVIFIMTLYYLVHWPDEDMRIYVWTVISTTISIFLAIFAFSSVQLIVEACFKVDDIAGKLALLGLAQLSVWYCVMQVSVAYVAGVMDDHPFRPEAEMKIRDQKMWRKISFKSVATLLAHCTGFAAINFGGALQHMYPFNISSATRFFVIPVMYAAQMLAGRLVRILRIRLKTKILHLLKRTGEEDSYSSLDLDNKGSDTDVDRTPRDKQMGCRSRADDIAWCLETWDLETYDAELDVAGLAVSFLTVQSIRASLTGVMPNNLGIEAGSGIHPESCSIYMIVCGVAFAILCVVHVVIHERYFPPNKKVKPLTCESALFRMVQMMQISCAMAFAWSLFVASKWEIARYLPQYQSNGVVSRVILTVELSFIAFWVILALDKLADAEWTGETADRAIITIIGALSTLVGFAYEQSFDGAVEALAARCFTSHPMLAELLLTLGVWLIVYPAWRKYILRKLVVLKEEKETARTSSNALDMASMT